MTNTVTDVLYPDPSLRKGGRGTLTLQPGEDGAATPVVSLRRRLAGRRLQVAATSLVGDATRTQLNLVLLPDTGDIAVGRQSRPTLDGPGLAASASAG